MALLVQKYGGTSMGSVERIDHVASKVAAARERGHQIVVVVSATLTAPVATLAASVAFLAISLMLAPISSAPVATVWRFWLTV